MKLIISLLGVIFLSGFSEARHPCACTREAPTICGSDGRWYTLCTLKCRQFEHPEEEVREAEDDHCISEQEWWITHHRHQDHDQPFHQGTPPPCTWCNYEARYICATDGHWHTDCTLRCKQHEHPDQNIKRAPNNDGCPGTSQNPLILGIGQPKRLHPHLW